jgi:cbb3-type cytochrome oxidase subunit 3
MKKYWILFAATVVVLLLLMAGMWWSFRKQRTQDMQALSQLRMNETQLVKSRNTLNQEVSVYKAYVFTQKQLNALGDSTIRAMRKELKYWKNLTSHTGITSITEDSISIPVHDTMWRTPDSVAVYAKKFDYADQWLTLHGMVVASSVSLDYFVKNEMNIDTYWKRDHWYSKRYLAGTITQLNPHTTTNRVVQFTVVAEPKSWYEKWWVHELIGVGIGATGTYFLMKK